MTLPVKLVLFRSGLGETVWMVILSLSLAIGVCFVSNNLKSDFDNRAVTIQDQFAVLDGQPLDFGAGRMVYLPAFQNRVLFGECLRGVSHIKILSVSQWYLIVRLLSAAIAFAVFFVLLRRQAECDLVLASFGCLVLAHVLVFTFNHNSESPTDFPDALFTMLDIALVLSRRFWVLMAVSMFAASNRESAAFAGVLWAMVYGMAPGWRRLNFRELIKGGVLSVVAYATVLGLRYSFAGSKAFGAGGGTEAFPGVHAMQGGQWLTGLPALRVAILEAIHQPTPSTWPVLAFAMAVPLLGWLYINRKLCSDVDRQIALTAVLLIGVTMFFGRVQELRIFIPSLVLLCYVATALEAERQRVRTLVPIGN